MREVRIHLTDCGDIRLYGEPHPVYVRSAEPPRSRSVEHRDPAARARGDRIGELPRAVRRTVVHDEHVDIRGAQERTNKRIQVVALVVRRNDDNRRIPNLRARGC